MFNGVFKRLKGFHSEEDGQSVVFIALSLLFIVMFVFMVINTGDITTRKMKMVTAADATAISGATWMARGYNTTAMLNVAESQLLAIIVLIKATKNYHTISATMLEVQLAIGEVLTGIPWTAPLGAFIVTYTNVLIQVDNAIKEVMETIRPTLVGDNDDGILWKLLEGVTKAEEVVYYVFPFIAQGQSVSISMRNGATLGFIYPMIPLVDLKFPFKEERKFEDLCKPTGEGKVEGFSKTIEHLPTTHYLGAPDGIGDFVDILTVGDFGPAPLDYFKAWLPYPALRLLPPFLGFVYDAVAKATLAAMCGGNSEFSYKTVKDGQKSCQDCLNNKSKLTKVHIGQTQIKTRFSMNGKELDDVVGTVKCDCDAPQSPKCKKMGDISDLQGNTKEFCGYMDIKSDYVGKAKVIDDNCWDTEYSNKTMINYWLNYLGNDCIRKKQTSYTTAFEEGIYDLPYVEGGTEPNMRIPQRDTQGNIIYDANGEIVYKSVKIYVYTETKLVSCEYEEKGNAEGFSGDSSSTKDKAKPYMLEDDWAEKKDYVGIVYMKPVQHVLATKNKLKNPNKLGMIYFSQAEIYVPDNVDAHLFNQCWRVRLVKFDKLSKLLSGSNSVDNQFGGMMGSVDEASGMGSHAGKFLSTLQSLGGALDNKIIIH
jgi:hypothetical protein